jgi:hypothetical protein
MITFVALIGGMGTEVERAHQQLLKVTQIRSDWNFWLSRWALEETNWLKKKGITEWINMPSSLRVCIPSAQNWEFKLLGSPLQFYLSDPKINIRVLANAFRKSDGTLHFFADTAQWPVTLDDFKQFWNFGDHIWVQIIERVDPEIHFISAKGEETSYSWTAPCAANSGLDLRFRRTDNICSRIVTQKLSGSVFCGDIPKTSVTVAVRVEERGQRASSNLRSWLVNDYRLQAAGVGFEKDFADLSKVTTHYGSLPLNQAMLVLEGELQRSGERVQLVGLNLPLKMLSITTVLIILAIQLYFWLHLRQFQPLDKDTEIAWVGLYDNSVARWVTVVTGVVLPVGTIIYVMLARFSLLNLVAVIFSASLAFLSTPLLWKLPSRSRLRYVPVRSRWAFSAAWKKLWH